MEGGGDLIGVGGVERLHAGGEHLRLHRRGLQHPMWGEGRGEVGRLELRCGRGSSWGGREGRSDTVLEMKMLSKLVSYLKRSDYV